MSAVYLMRAIKAMRRFNVMERAAGGMDPIVTRDSSLLFEVLEMAEMRLVACDPLRRDGEIWIALSLSETGRSLETRNASPGDRRRPARCRGL
jgi:ubiquinone biosynthesis protein UbiJ